MAWRAVRRRQCLSGGLSRTPGAYLTCTATSGSGLPTGTETTLGAKSKTPSTTSLGTPLCCVAAPGTYTRGVAARPAAAGTEGTAPAIGTAAWDAESCCARTDRGDEGLRGRNRQHPLRWLIGRTAP